MSNWHVFSLIDVYFHSAQNTQARNSPDGHSNISCNILRYLESKKGTTDTQIYLYFRRVKYFLRELPRKEALTNLEMDWLQFLHMVQRILPYGGQWAKTQTVQKCGNSEKNTITSTKMFSDSEKVQKVEQIKSHKWILEKAFTSTRKLGWTHLR